MIDSDNASYNIMHKRYSVTLLINTAEIFTGYTDTHTCDMWFLQLKKKLFLIQQIQKYTHTEGRVPGCE